MKIQKKQLKKDVSVENFLVNTSDVDNVLCFSHALKTVILYHQQLGIDPYPASDSLKRFCTLSPGSPEIPAITHSVSSPSEAGEGAAIVTPGKKMKESSVPVAPVFLGSDIASCAACALCRQRKDTFWGRRLAQGDGPIRLLLIGDWVRHSPQSNTEDLFFGASEDQMVQKMLAALALPCSQVFATNVLKCVFPVSTEMRPDYPRRCIGYLYQQIETLTPEYICTMGPLAAKTLLQTTTSLALLRGKLHFYEAKQRKIPVIPTYHPSFLLQNEEMKRPTWVDLQLLGRQMGLLR